MKQKITLIKLSDTHYVIVDDSEIKVGNWYTWEGDPDKNVHLCSDEENADAIKETRKETPFYNITHSTKPLEYSQVDVRLIDDGVEGWVFDKIKQLSLSEVEEAIYGYNTYDLLNKVDSSCEKEEYEHWLFKQGFKAHQELVKDKLFTVEDMKNLISEYRTQLTKNNYNHYAVNHAQIIQSLLPKTEWKVEFDKQGKLKLI